MPNPVNMKHESSCGVNHKTQLKKLFLGLITSSAVMMLIGQVQAQVQFPVALPSPKVGDIAKYRTIDMWTNKEISTGQFELVEIQAERLVIRGKSSAEAAESTGYRTREWNPCRSMQNSEQLVCGGALKFPLQIGNKHNFEKQPWSNRNGHNGAACEVKAEEKITLSAGAFDTVRIECAGFWNYVFGQSGNGQLTQSYWYAPAIGQVVKFQEIYLSGGRPYNKFQTELTEFIPAK